MKTADKIKTAICLIVMVIISGIFLIGCGEKKEEEKLELKVGDSGEYEWGGVTFTYEIKQDGAYIKEVQPDSGERLEFPQKIGDYTVYDVSSSCTLKYTEIKFNGLRTDSKGNAKTEKIEFYEDAILYLNCSFSRFSNLREVKIPDNCTQIGNNMFSGCSKLEKIDLSNVTSIGVSAFSNCTSLQNVDLSNVTSVRTSAFSNCTSLQNVDLSNVTLVGASAFENCTSLSCDLNFNEQVTFEERAFVGCEGLNGKTVTFQKQPDLALNNGFVNESFSGLDINITGTEVNEDIVRKLKAIDVGKLIGYGEGSDIFSTDFRDKMYEYFNGKKIKKGEAVTLNEIKPIITSINSDVNIVEYGKGHYWRGEAPRYVFVEDLSLLLSGQELDKDEIYDENYMNGSEPCGHKYHPLDYNMSITNTEYNEVYFYIDFREAKDNEGNNYSSYVLNYIVY